MDQDLEKINQLRQQIDQYDKQIVALLNKRAQCADGIGKVKRRLNMPVYVPSREEEVIMQVTKSNPGPLSEAAIARLYERIIDESRRLERENFELRSQQDDPA